MQRGFSSLRGRSHGEENAPWGGGGPTSGGWPAAFAFLLRIGTRGIRGITSGDIPLGLEELNAYNTHPVFGVWGLGFGVWGLATEEFGQLGPQRGDSGERPAGSLRQRTRNSRPLVREPREGLHPFTREEKLLRDFPRCGGGATDSSTAAAVVNPKARL